MSSCFGCINLAFIFLPYSMTFDNLPKLLLGHFSSIHFRFLLSLVNYFLNFIVYVFSTVAGYILIIGVSLPEMGTAFSHCD